MIPVLSSRSFAVFNLWRGGKSRVGSLDLLRSVAIVAVVLFHYGFKVSQPINIFRVGWTGVDLFFVLSGYLIG